MLLSLCRRHSGEPPDEEDYEHYFGPCLSSDPELLAVTSRQVFANFSAELMHTLLWQGEHGGGDIHMGCFAAADASGNCQPVVGRLSAQTSNTTATLQCWPP